LVGALSTLDSCTIKCLVIVDHATLGQVVADTDPIAAVIAIASGIARTDQRMRGMPADFSAWVLRASAD
jgi:hypothetical protein